MNRIKATLWIALAVFASVLFCFAWLMCAAGTSALGNIVVTLAILYVPWGIVAYYWEKLRRIEEKAKIKLEPYVYRS